MAKSKAEINEKSNTSIFEFSNPLNKEKVPEADSGTFTALLMKPGKIKKEQEGPEDNGFFEI